MRRDKTLTEDCVFVTVVGDGPLQIAVHLSPAVRLDARRFRPRLFPLAEAFL